MTMSTDAPYILQTMPTVGRLPGVSEWMKLQKAVNGQREVLHSAYGGSWVIHDPINSPGEFANGWCQVTIDLKWEVGGAEEDLGLSPIIPNVIIKLGKRVKRVKERYYLYKSVVLLRFLPFLPSLKYYFRAFSFLNRRAEAKGCFCCADCKAFSEKIRF